MYANNFISSIVSRQLPEFVRTDHAKFVSLLEKYYEYMEQTDKTMHAMKRIPEYMDLDTTRADLLQYFKNKVIPSFPEETALSKEKIMKAARDFYAKKGTPDGFKFLFRVLYGQEIEVYFPKEDILRASDGKWQLPQALRISVTDTSDAVLGGNVNVFFSTANSNTAAVVIANGMNFITKGIEANSYIRIDGIKRKVNNVTSSQLIVDVPFPSADQGADNQIFNSKTLYKVTLSPYDDFDFNLLERRKGYGSISKTSCTIESAVRAVDKDTGRDIVEIYVSNVKKPFETNEDLVVDYIDPTTNTTATFSSEIIALISNVYLTRNRFGVVQSGSRYKTGDPVVFSGGLNPNSDEAVKAVATVQNVSSGFLDYVTLEAPGYYFRDWANSIVQIENNTGIGANLIIDAIWDDGGANSASFNFNIDAIHDKLSLTLDAADYQFDGYALANADTTLADAFTYNTYTLGKIRLLTLVNRGSFYETVPTFDPISVHETDYTELNGGFFKIPKNAMSNYNPTLKTIQLDGANASYSTTSGMYTGARLFVEASTSSAHYVNIVDYIVENDGATYTKTLYLEDAFETNITASNAGNFKYYMDFRSDVRNTGLLAAVAVANSGSGYLNTDILEFVGTGYGAAATITVNGSGGITGVTLTDRGEGYVDRPTCVVVASDGSPSTGVGAVLTAYTLSDGESIAAATTGIGEIQSFDIINRGYDYVSAPAVSLKVADFLTDNLPASAIVVAGDSIWQGGATNASATFQATVDEVYRPTPTSSVIRVYNYNGTVDNNIPFKVNTATQNITCNLYTANVSISFNEINPATPRLYPFFYGNGLAKANSEFSSGLIRYNGYYLNTDGHISADKKLQNKDYYHNFSYEIQSEKSLNDYKKTMYDVAHPAGMQMLSKYVISDELQLAKDRTAVTGVDTSSNLDSVTISTITDGTARVLSGSLSTIGSFNEWEFTGNVSVGDLVKIGTSGVVKEVTVVDQYSLTITPAYTGAVSVGALYLVTQEQATFDTGYTSKFLDCTSAAIDLSAYVEVGDLIEIGTDEDNPPELCRVVRTVVDVVDDSPDYIELDSRMFNVGDGRLTLVSGSDQITVSGNNYPLSASFNVSDANYRAFTVAFPIPSATMTFDVLSVTDSTIEIDAQYPVSWDPNNYGIAYEVNGVTGDGRLLLNNPEATPSTIDVVANTSILTVEAGDSIKFIGFVERQEFSVDSITGNVLTTATNSLYSAEELPYVYGNSPTGIHIKVIKPN